jgi:hypothetical protein
MEVKICEPEISKTQSEQDQTVILGTLYAWHGKTDEPIAWTDETINQQSGVPWSRSQFALDVLAESGAITIYKGTVRITADGIDRYEAAKSKREIIKPGSVLEFRKEALSGMTEAGKETELEWVALPGPPERENPPTPEDMIGRSQEQYRAMERAAKKLGLSTAKFRELFSEGRIRECCVGTDEQHTGIFDKSGKGKTGTQYWRSKCRACLKGRGK